MPQPKKDLDFVASAPYERGSKHGGPDARRSYVTIACPHCDAAFVEIAADRLHTNKASECLKHLRVCDAAIGAGVLAPPAKRRAGAEELRPRAPPPHRAGRAPALTAERAIGGARGVRAEARRRQRAAAVARARGQAELAGLRAELEQMKLGCRNATRLTARATPCCARAPTRSGSRRRRCPRRTRSPRRSGLRRAARVARSVPAPAHAQTHAQTHALRQGTPGTRAEAGANELLLGALRTHNARALTTATAVRQAVPPRAPGQGEPVRVRAPLGEAVMQRLGELAQ